MISTHMPLARHDGQTALLSRCKNHFYSHASCEAWRNINLINLFAGHFYSHASCEAWRRKGAAAGREIQISTHMPLARHDIEWILGFIFGLYFYSHASCEAWPQRFHSLQTLQTFLLTCLLRGMTPIWPPCQNTCWISTHMPLARHDVDFSSMS